MYFGQPQAAQSYFGPNQGGGSLPALTMRTGVFNPFNARDVRSDIGVNRITDLTQLPTAQIPAPEPQAAATAGYFGDALGAPTGFGITASAAVASAIVGAAIGAATSRRGRRARGAGIGSLIGAAAMLIGGWAGGKAYLAATT